MVGRSFGSSFGGSVVWWSGVSSVVPSVGSVGRWGGRSLVGGSSVRRSFVRRLLARPSVVRSSF